MNRLLYIISGMVLLFCNLVWAGPVTVTCPAASDIRLQPGMEYIANENGIQWGGVGNGVIAPGTPIKSMTVSQWFQDIGQNIYCWYGTRGSMGSGFLAINTNNHAMIKGKVCLSKSGGTIQCSSSPCEVTCN